MTKEEKDRALQMIDNLESEVKGLVLSFGDSREWFLAITKLEESAMWMRKAVECS